MAYILSRNWTRALSTRPLSVASAATTAGRRSFRLSPSHVNEDLYAVADFRIVSVGSGTTHGKYVAEVQKVFEGEGLKHKTHAMGTDLEGPLRDVLLAVAKCHAAVHGQGAPKIESDIRLATSATNDGGGGEMERRVRSVDEHRSRGEHA